MRLLLQDIRLTVTRHDDASLEEMHTSMTLHCSAITAALVLTAFIVSNPICPVQATVFSQSQEDSSLYFMNPLKILSKLFSQPPANTSPMIDDSPEVSCPVGPPLNTQKRTEFGKTGGTAFGYPSSGGVLIKDLDVVDALYLRIDRFAASKRSSNVLEEDEFCERMRRIGATWWGDEQEYIDVLLGVRERTEVEARVLVSGWPSDGRGLWVLRYASDRDVPRDLGRVNLAVNMDERCRVMKEFGATFYPDPASVEELR